jgi:dedicator of cytokinesis protein 3
MSHRSTRPPSVFTDASGEEHLVHRDVVSLEVGDEVYAFERYTPRDKEVEGVWYRGCVDYWELKLDINATLYFQLRCVHI